MERKTDLIWHKCEKGNMPVVNELFLVAGFRVRDGGIVKITTTANWSVLQNNWFCMGDMVIEWWAVLPIIN